MKNYGLMIFCLFSLLMGCSKQVIKPFKLTTFVNPFIGSDGPGNTYPGATTPFGMVQLSPDIGIAGWDRISGYYYQDSIISGFSHTHLSGTGAGDMYDILVMPTNSRFSKKIKDNNFKPFSKFSHEQEAAAPGYYTVDLLDYGIKVALTATPRTGIHKYIFPKDSLSQIHIDLGYALNWDRPTETFISVVNNTTIQGYRKSTGWAKDQRVYFEIQLSKPFSSYQLYSSDSLVSSPVNGKNTKIILNYQTVKNEEIILKTGLSTASIKGAKKSLTIEAPHFNFERYQRSADSLWEKELHKINIETKDTDKIQIFYTMLYQSMLAPTLLSDLNGNYKGANDSIMHASGFSRYDTFSLWDTYRAAHPLYTVLHPNRVSDMINSMLAHYKETGLLPVWSMSGNETNMMIGYHAVPVLVDAYFKGIRGFDPMLAYEACKASANDSGRQIDIYKKLGYVPVEDQPENWSVSKTLEYAYDDWCIAQFANDLGFENEYQYFMRRSENWRNIYDSKSTFMRPKLETGAFIKEFVPKNYTSYFCESNAWQYLWSVQHDIEGLISALNGKEYAEKKLDSMFRLTPLPEDKLPIFSTGMIGQYAHGNEPSHHVAYLYNYVDKPWKTQELIKEILETQYQNTPSGLCGNEDCGQMSSWYLFSSLGFYPVNPAQGIYSIGFPIFDKAEINLENGSRFSIIVENNYSGYSYIESMTLNGKKLERNFITHNEITQGGTLVFVKGKLPNKTIKMRNALTSQIYIN